jgi:hypothetical protein
MLGKWFDALVEKMLANRRFQTQVKVVIELMGVVVIGIGYFIIQRQVEPELARAGCLTLWICPGIIVLGIISFFLRTD